MYQLLIMEAKMFQQNGSYDRAYNLASDILKNEINFSEEDKSNSYDIADCARFILADVAFDGRESKQNFNEALNLYKELANKGYRRGEFMLGNMLILQQNSNENDDSGLKWIEKSARKGHSPAYDFMADIHLHGIGVKKDIETAFIWYSIAAMRNNAFNNVAREVGLMLGLDKCIELQKTINEISYTICKNRVRIEL